MNKKIREIQKRNEPASLLGKGLKGLAGVTMATAGGWIIYSNLLIDHNVTLPAAIPADRATFESPAAGRISYYHNRSAEGRPLVLIHSVNAAASAYEMRPLFLRYQKHRPVYALDLPGFGFSERAKRVYSPHLFTEAVSDFLKNQIGEAADVVALSLGSEFASRAAVAQPDLFNSLTLISPSGFSLRQNDRSSQQASQRGLSNSIHPLLAFPLWGRALFDLIATRSSIEYFLSQSFLGTVPQDLIDYDYLTAHQPGAEHVPLYFISGKLFTKNIREEVYDRLQTPTLVLYDRDNFVSFDMLPASLANNRYLRAVRLVPSMGLPQFERLEDMVEVLNGFWR
jgi:pimeloyl-ACP methyl ester carboxylesterase